MLGLQDTDPDHYYYLNRTGGVYDVPDIDDTEEFRLTMVTYTTLERNLVKNRYTRT